MDSDSVVRSCKVAPPASLIDKLFPVEVKPPPTPPSEELAVTAPSAINEVAPDAEAVVAPGAQTSQVEDEGHAASRRLISHLLYLASSITGGVWTPVSEKDKELVLQIIAISADLIQVRISIRSTVN